MIIGVFSPAELKRTKVFTASKNDITASNLPSLMSALKASTFETLFFKFPTKPSSSAPTPKFMSFTPLASS